MAYGKLVVELNLSHHLLLFLSVSDKGEMEREEHLLASVILLMLLASARLRSLGESINKCIVHRILILFLWSLVNHAPLQVFILLIIASTTKPYPLLSLFFKVSSPTIFVCCDILNYDMIGTLKWTRVLVNICRCSSIIICQIVTNKLACGVCSYMLMIMKSAKAISRIWCLISEFETYSC